MEVKLILERRWMEKRIQRKACKSFCIPLLGKEEEKKQSNFEVFGI
jgi:hypothetical protein